jgi:hypothetical protein
MTGISLIALSPLQGAEGELKNYIRSHPRWLSPLPLIIPLHTFRESFPRDRIDPEKLRKLPALSLSGPVEKGGHIILALDSEPAPSPESYARVIHGKDLPPSASPGPFQWSGLLLNPAGLDLHAGREKPEEPLRRFVYPRWQIGMYRILYDEKRQWWEDVRISCQWKIRKGR